MASSYSTIIDSPYISIYGNVVMSRNMILRIINKLEELINDRSFGLGYITFKYMI